MVSRGILLPLVVAGTAIVCGCPKETPNNATSASATKSPSDPNPHWVVQQTPAAKVAVVYVHGIFGDMTGTWTADNGETFYSLVDQNPATKGKADEFVYGFPSSIFKNGSFDIREAANRLHERLDYAKVLNYPAVVFVAHSMGGLVVLRELLTHRELLPKVPVVVFYATPQEGSQITVLAKMLSPNTALAQMTPADGNDLLKTLSDEWNTVPTDQRPHVRCAYEKKPTKGVMIVPWSSATRFCEGAPAAIAADHISIVKPEAPGDDAIVVLVNALDAYVLNRNLEAKLETPDFTTEGSDNVFILKDSMGKQPARLVNAGGSPLRFTLAEISDPTLLLWPDDTPRDIPANATVNMSVALARAATLSEYHFILRTTVAPDKLVIVRVPDLPAIKAQQEEVARNVSAALNAVLADPKSGARFSQAAADNQAVPEAFVRVARKALAKQVPGLPDSAQWVLTADLLNSFNWPGLAARALKNAEGASPSVVHMPGVQQLAGLVAAQSGEKDVFAASPTPFAPWDTAPRLTYEQPLAQRDSAAVGTQLATLMSRAPGLKVYGLSLQGDIQQARGEYHAAQFSYKEAAMTRPSPSLQSRLMIANDAEGMEAKTPRD